MATFDTDIITAQESVTARNLLPGRRVTGNLVWLEAVYTATGTEAATGDSIDICDLPIGAQVFPELIRIINEASMGGSDLALPKIGDAVDDDRYTGTSVSVHSSNAAVQTVTPNVAASGISRHTVTADTRRVTATFTRTNAMTAGKKIKFVIPYLLA
jgi:hypothetical protein